jgi:CRISPR/Cas system-associated endonuclease Cas3-HD
MKKLKNTKQKGITLIALVVTTIFSYDEKLKSSNNNGFLLQTI